MSEVLRMAPAHPDREQGAAGSPSSPTGPQHELLAQRVAGPYHMVMPARGGGGLLPTPGAEFMMQAPAACPTSPAATMGLPHGYPGAAPTSPAATLGLPHGYPGAAPSSPGSTGSDTTQTKIFVGGLPYHTTDQSLRKFFEQFGEIDEAVVITDRVTSKSKGYGFVTMADGGAAERACQDANPIIDGRKSNVNLAYLGAKPRTPVGVSPLSYPGGLPGGLPAYTMASQVPSMPQYMYAASPQLSAPGMLQAQQRAQLSPAMAAQLSPAMAAQLSPAMAAQLGAYGYTTAAAYAPTGYPGAAHAYMAGAGYGMSPVAYQYAAAAAAAGGTHVPHTLSQYAASLPQYQPQQLIATDQSP